MPAPNRVTNIVEGPSGRLYSQPGGGYEMNFPDAIPPEYITVVTPKPPQGP